MKNKSKILSLLFILSAFVLPGCIGQSVPRTKLTINPLTHQVTIDNPKDTTIKNFSAAVDPTGGSRVTFDSLTTVMNPDVITTTGEAQAKIVTATATAVTQAIAVGAATAAKTVASP